MKSQKTPKYIAISLFLLGVFIAMYIFFAIVHPLYIYDVDDWNYIKGIRPALPTLTQWNPTKILPETVFPLVSFLASSVIYPFTGDFIQAICVLSAGLFAMLITLYLGMTALVLKRRFGIKESILIEVMCIFILAHFGAYMIGSINYHVLYGGNVNGYYNYILPALWNFLLVLYFMQKGKTEYWYKNTNYVRCGLLILAVYLAINSNLWHSVILMVYFGVELLFDLIGALYHKNNINSLVKTMLLYLKEHVPQLVALAAWFISMIYEIKGNRANWAEGTQETLQIAEAVKVTIHSVGMLNKVFLTTVILINLVALLHILHKKDSDAKRLLYEQLKIGLALFFTIVFLILVASKVSPEYMERPGVMISWMLWLMLITVSSLVYILKCFSRVSWLLPLAAYILVFSVVITENTRFAENCAIAFPPATVKAIDDDIILQIKNAEAAGKTQVTVYIPVKGSGGWPINPEMLQGRIAGALYSNGVTDKLMEIYLVPDISKDIEFHLN